MSKFATVLLTLLLMLLFGGNSRAETEHRIALVIGNSAYQHLPRLANPVNDAQLIAATLESVGFKLIGGKAQIDLDQNSLEAVIRQLGAELAGSRRDVLLRRSWSGGARCQFLSPDRSQPRNRGGCRLRAC